MKRQKTRSESYLPVTLYLETIRQKCKKKLDRIVREIGTILFICQSLLPETSDGEGGEGEAGYKWNELD